MPTPFRQLESVTSYTADGVQTAWNFTFSSGYLDQTHVKAYQLSPLGVRTDLPVTSGMFAGPYQLTISPPVPAGYEVTIYRQTPTSAPLVNFADASAFTEASLDTAVKQAVFSAAETRDALSIASTRIDQIGTFAQSASDSAASALASKNAAATSAQNAATSEGNANTSAQAAAASALSVNQANLVHLAGAETITGVKTFSAQPVGITAASVGLGNVTNTSDANKPVSTAQAAAMALLGGFKNKVRNGKMDLAMRGTSFPGCTTGTYYCLDGWLYSAGGVVSSVTVTQGAGLLTQQFQSSFVVTVNTADTSPTTSKYAEVVQKIEGYLIRDLIGNPIAIQFEVKSPKAGQHYVAIRNAVADRSYILPYTVTAANTAQLITLALPGGLITAGTWNWNSGAGMFLDFPLLVGPTLTTASTGSWQTGSFLAGTAQQNLLDTVGNVFAVTGVQLERDRGQGATSYEHRDIAVETMIGYRYCVPLGGTQAPGQAFTAASGACYLALGGSMRASPTISNGAGWTVTTAGGGVSACTPSVDSLYNTSIRLGFSGATGMVAGNAAILVAPAGVYLTAEL